MKNVNQNNFLKTFKIISIIVIISVKFFNNAYKRLSTQLYFEHYYHNISYFINYNTP